MQWMQQGLLPAPFADLAWMRSHAALPVADHVAGDVFAIYFSARDEQNRAQIGRIDATLRGAGEMLKVYPEPVIPLGSLGSFDDSGVTSACIVNHKGRKYQYYSGWTLGITVPFYFYIGLAVSEDGGATYQKVWDAPVLGRSAADPYLTASPCVLVENGIWRMWYVSGVRWVMENGKPKHYYHIKYTESADGIRWANDRKVCIDFQSPDEYAIARPCVNKEGGVYRMWYCYRGAAYRIGYAESPDGLTWTRRDAEAGISPPAAAWDSEMQAYPHVFQHNGRMYMLYNGNSYGRTGVGIALEAPRS